LPVFFHCHSGGSARHLFLKGQACLSAAGARSDTSNVRSIAAVTSY
jgi:hypothetical protein